jgi:insertion element IS1 protein InsB
MQATKKNVVWVWAAIDEVGKEWMGFELGARDAHTGLKLWKRLEHRTKRASVATDHWEAYKEFVPPVQHIHGRGTTSLAECFNARLRHYLARLHRKTKCYSKSVSMLSLSIKLLILHLNHSPTIYY